MADFIMTPEFRVSFPNVFEAKSIDGGEAKYSIAMLFSSDTDINALKKEAMAAAVEMFGDDAKDMVKKGKIRWPFRSGAEKDHLGGYDENTIFVSASSKQRPGIVDGQMQPCLPEDFYPGCYARAKIRAFAYDVKGNKGVSFGLGNIQKLRDGEPLGSRRRPEDDFDPVGNGGGSSADIDDMDVEDLV